MSVLSALTGGLADTLDLRQKDFDTTTRNVTAPISPAGQGFLSNLQGTSDTQSGLIDTAGADLNRSFGGGSTFNDLFNTANSNLLTSLRQPGGTLTSAQNDLFNRSFADSRTELQKYMDSAVGKFGQDSSGSNLAANLGIAADKQVSTEAQARLNYIEALKARKLGEQKQMSDLALKANDARAKLAGVQTEGARGSQIFGDIARANLTTTETKPGPSPTSQLATLLAGIGAFSGGGTGAGGLGGALSGLGGGVTGALSWLMGGDTPAGKQVSGAVRKMLGLRENQDPLTAIRGLLPSAAMKLYQSVKSMMPEVSDWDALESQFVTGADGQYDALEGGIFDDGGVTDFYDSGGIDTTGMDFDFGPTTDSIFQDNSLFENPDTFFDVLGGGDNLSFPYYSPDLDMTGGMFDWGGEAFGNPTEALSQMEWGW